MFKNPFFAALVCVFAFAVTEVCAQLEQFKFKRLELKDGLSHPDIWAIFKNSRGFVWIGTENGLNRFDGYTIRSYLPNSKDTASLPAAGVHRIFESPDGLLAVLTTQGLALYNPATEKFQRDLRHFYKRYNTSKDLFNIVRDPDGSFWFVESTRLVKYHPREQTSVIIQNDVSDSLSMVSSPVTNFCIDRRGNRWVVHANGMVEKIDVINRQGRVVERISTLPNRHAVGNTTYDILADADGDLWFCAPSLGLGVYFYNIKENKFEQISAQAGRVRLNTNSATTMIQDDNGLIWIGTDHGGINIIDKRNWKIRYILHHDGDKASPVSNSITRLYKDDQGIIWTGAYRRGISYYHPNIYKFELYKHYAIDPGSLPFEDINRFEEDPNGNLWIGTNGGGLIYFDRQNEKFTQYLNEPGNPNSLSGNVVVSLCQDSDNNLWIGTYKAGLNKFDGKKFTRFAHNPADTTSLQSQNIWEIFEDSKKRIWVGSIDASAAILDKKSGKFHRIKAWVPGGLQSGTIGRISEDRHGNLWFGHFNGVDIMSEDGKVRHYKSSDGPNSLRGSNVSDIMKDSKGRMWVATTEGLNLFDESINGFRAFNLGRPGHGVVDVEEDRFGNLWMSTLNGITKMTFKNGSLDSVSFKHYTESDGLHGRQFSVNAGFKTRNGELVFGGPTGFNISTGSALKEDFLINKVVFTELEVYERPVEIGEKVDGTVVLSKSISEAEEIVLPPNRDFFSLKFSALNYFNPERDQYVYKIEGLKTGWLPVDATSHEIVFNSLNPGKYILRVRAANSDGVWSDNQAILSITILPTFWKTKTAFGLYTLMLVGILFIARRIIQQREKLKYTLERERQEMQRIHELDMMKVKFFTNVSHEFRTPLTLILTPIETLMKRTTDPQLAGQFQMIHRNGRRLMNLVNQLLDFKKLEEHETRFNPGKGDIVAFIKDTVSSFSDLSEKKNIKLLFYSGVDRLETLFDHDKVEKIMFNLLGNAFKFTLENGVVSVRLEHVLSDNRRFVQILVSDTGIGIPENKREKIFEPFFQNDIPKNIVNQGSGIGLAITREFVKIHGGTIDVSSEVGRGTTFKVMLPLKDVEPEQVHPTETMTQPVHEPVNPSPIEMDHGSNGGTTRKSLLLIDDNDDFRFYLRDNLKFLYTIHEARDGAEGWNMTLTCQPDLIVSDVMMPEMDGTELCSRIKSDERVSHIPVILLTARSSEDQRIEGLRTGADDYITKPFNFEVLEARISNLLNQREKFQKRFRNTLDVKSSELQITPLDVTFIEKAVKIVEANISSSNFSVEDLALELAISRAYVFKKILALTGKTPLEFIRTIRLQHAAQLLEKSQLSVREVAYKVGFNNPKYFTKYFKEHYNILPSDYAASKGDQD